MQPTVQMRDVWTVEDVQALEVEDVRRYEIVDGALLVSPTPGLRHESVIARIRNAVQSSAGPEVEVLTGNVGIAFARSYRIPDLVVVPADFASTDALVLVPADVHLAVEVVSPGSVTTDRITKPAQYAAARIAHYWRVETDPVSLTAYALPAGGSVYTEAGTWSAGEIAHLTAPFAVDIELDRLLGD